MKPIKCIKIVLIVLVVMLIIVPSFNIVLGAINEDYIPSEQSEVSSEDVHSNFLVEYITQYLSNLLFYFGQLVEWLLSIVALIFTGEMVFPWADLVIFNAVPILDINFINPSSASLMGQIQDLVRNLYFTILSIAIAFFGVTVLIMAIRLLTTAIASEKAKYKEAIKNWIIGIIALFMIHYFIAFVFYLNESMVKIASNIATESIEDKFEMDPVTSSEIMANLRAMCEEVRDRNFFERLITTGLFAALNFSVDASDVSAELLNTMDNDPNMEETILKMLQDNDTFRANLFNYTGVNWMYYLNRINNYGGGLFYNDAMGETIISINEFTKSVKADAEKMNSDENYWINKFLKGTITDEELKTAINSYNSTMQAGLREKIAFTVSTTVSEKNIKQYCSYVKRYNDLNKNDSVSNKGGVIVNLANYFKYSSLKPDENAIVATDRNPQNVIMYVIFIAQSIIYFFVYIRRLFYVLILSMLAPIIVVYDFFTKSIA